MAKTEIEVELRTTWIKYFVIFLCKYVKSKFILSKLFKTTIAKVYINGSLNEKINIERLINNEDKS